MRLDLTWDGRDHVSFQLPVPNHAPCVYIISCPNRVSTVCHGVSTVRQPLPLMVTAAFLISRLTRACDRGQDRKAVAER
jgi:hypothetical protein